MGTGAEIGIAIALTAASTAASMAASSQSNSQARAIADYQNKQKELAYAKSVAFNRAAGQIKATEERRTLQLKYDLMKGASISQGAERGVLESNSEYQTLNALGYGAARESAKISMESNLADLGFQINATPQWSVAPSQNMFLSGIQGGLQGLQLGMNVAGSMNSMDRAGQIQGIQSGNTTTGNGFNMSSSMYEPNLNLNIPTGP